MNLKKRILFLHQSWRGFEKRDFEILKDNFSTRELLIYKNLFYKMPSVIREIKKTDVIFCWFAYRAAFFPLLLARLLRKKIILVAGGWDCANVPEIEYGAMRQGVRFLPTRIITKFIIKLADRIIAVSEYNKREIITNYCNSLDRINMIYHGIPVNCCSDKLNNKEDLVLTVGEVSESNLKRKGLEVFIKVAKRLPDIKFTLVGKIDKKIENYISSFIPENLEIIDSITDDELHVLYRRAKVYVQVSYHEQFGSALAEAMAHKCVPVVTDRTALPEVVGDTGYYVPYGDIEKTANAIEMALKDTEKGKIARERIARLFSFEKREKLLVELINNLI